MNKKSDVDQDKVTDGTESNEEGKQTDMHKLLEKTHSSWEKLRSMFEESGPDLKDTQYPIMIITVSCVVIAICAVFMTFTQLGMARSLRQICMMQRGFFPF